MKITVEYLGKDVHIAELSEGDELSQHEIFRLTKKFEEKGSALDIQETMEILMEMR